MKRAMLILALQSLCVMVAGGQAAQQPAAPLQRHTLAQPSRETVQQWFDQEWERAQSMPDFGDCSISWTLEVVYVPPAAELRNLAQSVQDRPDHPDRWLLESYKRRMQGQFDRIGRRMWVRGDDAWRVSQDMGGGQFDDYTITDRHAWRVTPQQLIIANPSRGNVDFDSIAGLSKGIWPELTRLLHGGLSFGAISGLEPGPLQLTGERWRVIVSLVDAEHELQQFEIEFFGRWDQEADRGFVESMTILKSPKPGSVGTTTKFIDWTWVETLDHWVAGRAETFKPDGRPDRNLIFDEARCDPEFSFRKVVQIPDKERGDILRGPIAFRRIEDHRKGIIREIGIDGTVTTTAILPDAAGSNRGWRRWMGVLVLTALSVGFVALYLKRRSAA